MKLSELIEGLLILRPHYEGEDGYHIGCEHDQFYAYTTDTPLGEEEVARLKEIGWFQPEEGTNEAPYNAEEGWSAYV